MNCELISVGTEMLTGAIVNTNAQYLAEELSDMGIRVHRVTTVGDNPGRLEESLRAALTQSDLVILTGGLGPTQDDLTKETAAKVFGRALERHPELEAELLSWFEKRGFSMTENNRKQADIPEGAKILKNNNGTAPGILIQSGEGEDRKTVILLPGPPGEMKQMFEESVRPILKEASEEAVSSHYYHLTGIGESAVEDRILDLVNTQTNPTIATYAKPDQVLIRVTASAKKGESPEKLLEDYDIILKERFQDYIFCESRETLGEWVGNALIESGKSISSAESLTAGLVMATLAEVPGISASLQGGVVCYNNEMKEKLLGVSHETLRLYGAVSAETCREMAEKVRLLTGSDIGVATTGLAGPDAEEGKPVGLVYTAVSTGEQTFVEESRFRGSRNEIRMRTVNRVFRMIREHVFTEKLN